MADVNEPTSNPAHDCDLGQNVALKPVLEAGRKLPLIPAISRDLQSGTAQVLESAESEEQRVLLKIAHAFFKNQYPLSASGKDLKGKIEIHLANKDMEGLRAIKSELPTVEHPHLELFAELDLSPEEIYKIMGPDLANIQVTKGCSHKCDFCAAGAEGKVTFMPYAAILKLALEKKRVEDALDQKIDDYCVRNDTGQGIWAMVTLSEYKSLFKVENVPVEMELKRMFASVLPDVLRFADGPSPMEEKLFQGTAVLENFMKLQGILSAHDNNITKTVSILIEHKKDIIAYLKAINSHLPHDKGIVKTQGFLDQIERLPENFDDIRIAISNDSYFGNFKGGHITNYYDSDPFDYRDSSFLHEDGTPADFGDVVSALGTKNRKIQITTAGWSLKDKVAQRAAEKVAESPYINLIRISINASERDAKRDYASYVAKLKQVIRTFRKTFFPPKPRELERGQSQTQILLFPDPGNIEYQTNVVQPINRYCEELNVHFFIIEPSVSNFSGPMEVQNGKDAHHDVMACMPGHHIWPDGTIANQALGIGYLGKYGTTSLYEDFGAPKGSRPTPTGQKLFHTAK